MKSKTQPPQSAGKIFLALGAIWAGLSLLFLVLGLRTIQSEQEFQMESVAVPGTLSSKRVLERNGIDPSTKRPTVSRTYYLTASFADERQQEREVETSVSAERWENSRENDAVEVRYHPSDPTRSRIVGEGGIGQAYVFTGLGALGVLMGLVVGISEWRKGGRTTAGPGRGAAVSGCGRIGYRAQ